MWERAAGNILIVRNEAGIWRRQTFGGSLALLRLEATDTARLVGIGTGSGAFSSHVTRVHLTPCLAQFEHGLFSSHWISKEYARQHWLVIE